MREYKSLRGTKQVAAGHWSLEVGYDNRRGCNSGVQSGKPDLVSRESPLSSVLGDNADDPMGRMLVRFLYASDC